MRQFGESPQFTRVIALTRRPFAHPASARVESRVVDFERLDEAAEHFRVSHIVCALGTTIKQAGTRERFRRVDHDYPLAAARLGLREGARHFLLVSALGASARSRMFYSRVKGDVEDAIRALPYRSVTIVRPSLLLGERAEFRLGESIGKAFREGDPGAVPTGTGARRRRGIAQGRGRGWRRSQDHRVTRDMNGRCTS